MSSTLAINLKILAVVLGTLGVFTWVANAIPQLESQVPEELSFTGEVSTEELVSAGEQLYNGAGGCGACHGLGVRAPNLLTDEGGEGTIGQRCGNRVPGEDCKTYLFNSLIAPASFLVGEYGPIMPDVSKTMSPTQVWALVAYLEDQGGVVTVTGEDVGAAVAADPGGAATTVAATPASISTDPLEIMRGNQCFFCHMLGEEGIELGPPFDGLGQRVSGEYIRNSILNPGSEPAEGYDHLLGSMPPNFGDILTAGQLEALVQFLSSQQ